MDTKLYSLIATTLEIIIITPKNHSFSRITY